MGAKCCCQKAAEENEKETHGIVQGSSNLEEQFLENARAASERFIKYADPSAFDSPAKPVGVSGGTAAFYAVTYAPNSPRPAAHGQKHWIGKDLARAEDELGFYERARRLLHEDPLHWRLLRWAFDYGGVVDIQCLVDGKHEPRKQLLLRNLFDGVDKLRLLDVKIGAVTAVGGWQGKSHFRATRQKIVDQATNSAIEGYRAEGFESPPDSLVSLLELNSGKKQKRVALQRLCSSDFFRFWVMMPPEEPSPDHLSGSEVACRALRRAVHELTSIVAASAAIEVPQQWIGSSAAIAFDAAARPQRPPKGRPVPTPAGPEAARINVFDWGRSELTTLDMYEVLSGETKQERAKHWASWVSGMIRLAFEAARAYRRTYCPLGGRWRTMRLRVWSFKSELQTVGSVTASNEIGTAVVPFGPTHGVFEVPLHRDSGLFSGAAHTVANAHVLTLQAVTKTFRLTRKILRGKLNVFKEEQPTVRFTVEGPLPFPEGSDLTERWIVHVHSAKNLPKTEVTNWCNAVVTISLIDEVGAESVAQTQVAVDNANPAWNERLEFCVAAPHTQQAEALLPQELAEQAPSTHITGWDLAEEGRWHGGQAEQEEEKKEEGSEWGSMHGGGEHSSSKR
eukprot:Hpha_TRINITY_DN7323_c0_g1::TRINITY_DN7323_c0_g1_i1::g.9979::m.9979